MHAAECPNDEQLASFALGDLREVEFSTISRHVETCGACESRLDSLEGVCDPVVSALRRPGVLHSELSSVSGSSATRRRSSSPALPTGTVLGDYEAREHEGTHYLVLECVTVTVCP